MCYKVPSENTSEEINDLLAERGCLNLSNVSYIDELIKAAEEIQENEINPSLLHRPDANLC